MGKATGSGKGDKQLRPIQKLKLKFQDPDMGSAMPNGSRTDRRLRGKPRLATSPLHLMSRRKETRGGGVGERRKIKESSAESDCQQSYETAG